MSLVGSRVGHSSALPPSLPPSLPPPHPLSLRSVSQQLNNDDDDDDDASFPRFSTIFSSGAQSLGKLFNSRQKSFKTAALVHLSIKIY